jgi:hypothetical protein
MAPQIMTHRRRMDGVEMLCARHGIQLKRVEEPDPS